MTYVIVGGSAGVGRALAEKYASEGKHLVVISQDYRDSEALAKHLRIVHKTTAVALEIDLSNGELSYEKVDAALTGLPPLAGVLVPAGLNDDADKVGLADSILETITRVNYLAPCKIINHLLPVLRKTSGSVIGFGSIAATRGRSKNAGYAAAKNALNSYFESLQHDLINSTIVVQFYVLGYVDTNLAFAQKLLFPRVKPEDVADYVLAHNGVSGRFFFPRYWRPVCAIVRWLPWIIFKRLSI